MRALNFTPSIDLTCVAGSNGSTQYFVGIVTDFTCVAGSNESTQFHPQY